METCKHEQWQYKEVEPFGMVPCCPECDKIQVPFKFAWVTYPKKEKGGEHDISREYRPATSAERVTG